MEAAARIEFDEYAGGYFAFTSKQCIFSWSRM